MSDKILIIGAARSGTSSLLHSISTVKNIPYMFEPLTRGDHLIYDIVKSNIDKIYRMNKCVVKILPFHQLDKWTNLDNYLDFIKSFSSKFDNTILLNRIDFNEHLISAFNLRRTIDTFTHFDKYYIDDDYINEYTDYKDGVDVQELTHSLIAHRMIMDRLSEELDVPITYYEDLYNENKSIVKNTIKSWNIDINVNDLSDLLDIKHRYRQLINKKTLI